MSKSFTTQALAEALDGQLIGDGAIPVTRLAHPADIRDGGDLALAMEDKLLPLLTAGKVRAAVVNQKAKLEPGTVEACIIVNRPRLAMAKLTSLFAVPTPILNGIHATAVIEQGASLGQNVSIGAQAYVGAGAVIGDHCTLHPQTYIAPGAVIGANALIYPGVKIGSHVRIGANSIIHFNASIGADGFSFVTPEAGSVEQAKAGSSGDVTTMNGTYARIFSLGGVEIGNDVEIGANTSIDQGTIMPTKIGNGTKIDNQVQIGHNVVIGENCLVCGRVGIAGSAKIGNNVVLGGAVGIADHVSIGDDAMVMAMSGVAGNVLPRTIVGGLPAHPRQRMMENYFNVSRLKHFFRKIDALTERLDKIAPTEKTGD